MGSREAINFRQYWIKSRIMLRLENLLHYCQKSFYLRQKIKPYIFAVGYSITQYLSVKDQYGSVKTVNQALT
jgi:hypothetical protein